MKLLFLIVHVYRDILNTISLVELSVEGGLYAIFRTPKTTHHDFVNTIQNTWKYINKQWIPSNGYKRSTGYEFETYIEESRLFSETIYIPIKEE